MADRRHRKWGPARGSRWPVLRVALAAVVAVLLAACSGVPTAGTRLVQGEQAEGAAAVDAFVHLRAPGPEAGLTPLGVLNRFLAASAGFDEDFRTARSFLTPQAAKAWRPRNGTYVFTELRTTPVQAGEAGERVEEPEGALDPTQTIVGELVARVAADGSYSPLLAPESVVITVHLERSGTEDEPVWQVDDFETTQGGADFSLASGVLLERADAERVLAPLSLYWPDPTGTTLVPEPLLLPRGTGGPSQGTEPLLRELVSQLLEGPGARLAGAVAGRVEGVAIGSLVQSGTEVRLQLTGDERLADAQLRLLRTQLAVTLRQPGLGITVVRVDGSDVTDYADDLDAGWTTPRQGFLAVEQETGRAVTVPVEGRAAPSTFPPLEGQQVRHPAVAAVLPDRAAALTADLRSLLVVSEGLPPAVAYTAAGAGGLAPPSVDALGAVWTVDRSVGGVVVAEPGEQFARRVDLPQGLPEGYRLKDVEPAPDGVRIALVLCPALPDGSACDTRPARRAATKDLVLVAPVVRQAADPAAPSGTSGIEMRFGSPEPVTAVEPFSAFEAGWTLVDLEWANPLVLTVLGRPSGREATAGSQQLRVGQLQDEAVEPLPQAEQIAVAAAPAQDGPLVVTQLSEEPAEGERPVPLLRIGTQEPLRGYVDPSFPG